MSDFIDETYKRVEWLIGYKGLRISSFEEKIKVSNNSIGTAIRRKASFKSNVLNKILNSFPDINPTWLLTGKGSEFLGNQSNVVVEEPELNYKTSDLKTVMESTLIDLLNTDAQVNSVLEKKILSILKNNISKI